jgi:hypothetical protein
MRASCQRNDAHANRVGATGRNLLPVTVTGRGVSVLQKRASESEPTRERERTIAFRPRSLTFPDKYIPRLSIISFRPNPNSKHIFLRSIRNLTSFTDTQLARSSTVSEKLHHGCCTYVRVPVAMASARVEEDMAGTACGVVGGGIVTVIEDLPADVLGLVLRRLDGASLAAMGCASSGLRELAGDPDAWRALCLDLWPSVRDIVCLGGGYKALYADAFPFPAAASSPTSLPLPARLVSAVDLRHNGVCVMSRVVETDASSPWFLGSPFRVDALVQEGFTSPTPIAPDALTLSWILIDPATGTALNASSRRPVSVDRSWLSGDAVVRFTVVLGGGVALDAAVTCDDRHGHVREVSLCAGDAEGGGVSGRDGLAAVAAAMASARQRRGAEEAARRVYEEFAKGKRERKEWKARREGIVDLCCSGVGAAAFLSFLVMFTFR